MEKMKRENTEKGKEKTRSKEMKHITIVAMFALPAITAVTRVTAIVIDTPSIVFTRIGEDTFINIC